MNCMLQCLMRSTSLPQMLLETHTRKGGELTSLFRNFCRDCMEFTPTPEKSYIDHPTDLVKCLNKVTKFDRDDNQQGK